MLSKPRRPPNGIGPATSEEITVAGAEKRPLIIYPLAFTQEHVETLAELDIEYRHLAEEAGVPFYARVPTVGVHPDFIQGLARLVQQTQATTGICTAEGRRICPATFRRCCMEQMGSI